MVSHFSSCLLSRTRHAQCSSSTDKLVFEDVGHGLAACQNTEVTTVGLAAWVAAVRSFVPTYIPTQPESSCRS